jgi:hypothetical protein
MEDQASAELLPAVTGVGLKEAEQVGAGTVVTVAVQVALVPAAFFAVRVHVWVDVGEKARDPLAVASVPPPRFPVQL